MQPCEKTEGIVTSLKQKLTFRYQGAPELPLWIQWLAPEWWNCGQQKQQISVKEAYLSFVAWTLEYSETILSENLIPECIEYFSQRGLDWNKVVQSSGGVRRTPFVYAIRNGSWDTSVAILDRVAVLDIDGEIKDIFSSLLQFLQCNLLRLHRMQFAHCPPPVFAIQYHPQPGIGPPRD